MHFYALARRCSRVLALSVLCVAACGGGPAAATPHEGASSGSREKKRSDAASNNVDVAAKPKKASKYPDPFYEPDCSSVSTDGYLADAQKVLAEVRRKNWDRLKSCVDGMSDVHVEVDTSFRLDPDGKARCVDAPGADDEVVRCVIAMYRTFQYPSPKGGSVQVSDGLRFDVDETDE